MSAKLFIGPMSKNIVDVIIEYSNNNDVQIGLIPSRRQIEMDGGYVNNWTTEDFCKYVKSKSKNILLVRDHAGPLQGNFEDNGIDSFKKDCKYFDVVHIDVWKKYKNYKDGLNATIDMIMLGFKENPDLLYEIGTEESIRPFTPEELDNLITDLKSILPEDVYKKIKYVVIQSGTALQGNQNIGNYDNSKLIKMLNVIKKHNLISKEHNGDYIEDDILRDKFICGLQTINIAPEFGQLETKIILEEISSDENLLEIFYKICYDSKRWIKWVSGDFIPSKNKIELINICGHYVFSSPDFLKIKKLLAPDIDKKIKNKITERIYRFMNNIEISNEKLLASYFEMFSNKDIEGLSSIFNNDIILTDWEISAKGKDEVIKANQKIFNSVDTIKVKIIDFVGKNNEYYCQLVITINETTKIDVLDIIKFKDNKIVSIKAYKG